CYSYCMLAAGHVDLVVETELKPYDIAALIPIVTGAGGVVTTWEGKPAQGGGRIVAAGDARVHEGALKLLNGYAKQGACMKKRPTLLIAFLWLLPTLASAQNFPAKPIKLIVPFPAGGPNDIIARVIGQRMSELSGQPVLIDNRGGQGGVLGTDAVAKSAPDGYTIAISSAGA